MGNWRVWNIVVKGYPMQMAGYSKRRALTQFLFYNSGVKRSDIKIGDEV